MQKTRRRSAATSTRSPDTPWLVCSGAFVADASPCRACVSGEQSSVGLARRGASRWERRSPRSARSVSRLTGRLMTADRSRPGRSPVMGGHGGQAGETGIVAARGESPSAFDERCLLAACVARPSNTGGIRSRRALSARRLARLGAAPDFHHGLPADPVAPMFRNGGRVSVGQVTGVTWRAR